MKSKHKRLPPHSWEAHPKANKKDAHKQLTIVVVTIGAIVVLALLLFLGQKQFAGKAFFSPAQENSFGISQPAPIGEGEDFFLTVETNIGSKETVGVMFELDFPDGLECTKVESMLGWESNAEFSANDEILSTSLCDNSNKEVVFERATTNYMRARTGTFPIAKIYFKGALPKTYDLKFDVVNALNLADNTPITLTIENPTIEVIAKIKDTDNDGLPDDWEKKYDDVDCEFDYTKKDSDGNSVADSLDDYDSDGINNFKEYTSSGNPCVASALVVEPGCGNGIIESDEFCDGTSFSGLVEGCIDKGFPIGGAPTCKDACTSVDYSSCQKSQKGQECVLDPVEEGMESTCAAGLKCEENDDEKLVCISSAADVKIGGKCDVDANCKAGLVCGRHQCTSPKCAEAINQLDPDDIIDIYTSCKDVPCASGYICASYESGKIKLCVPTVTAETFKTECIGFDEYCKSLLIFGFGACTEGQGDCEGVSCASGLTCTGTNDLFDSSIKVCEKTGGTPPSLDKPIDIKLTPISKPAEIAINSVGKSKDYDITVTITPDTALPAGYLMIAVVNYGTHQSTKFIDDSNPALSVGSSKTFKFPHTVDSSATNLTVSAMVWNGYLTDGFVFNELVPKKDEPYEIS